MCTTRAARGISRILRRIMANKPHDCAYQIEVYRSFVESGVMGGGARVVHPLNAVRVLVDRSCSV
eukprot:scaffold222056_cov30-Tisochrysis_lutea.AAC.1